MGGGVFRLLRLAFVTLYALTTLVAVLMLPAHAADCVGAAAPTGASITTAVCAGQQGKAGRSNLASVCCDVCDSSVSTGLEPPSVATFLIRHEFSTRLNFAQRLGRVADATPDDLRSRAPPAL
jgi:hypothetical protein